jgi:hypothetical protein
MLFRITASILGFLIFASPALGHARWLTTGTTPPRSSSSGLKSGPCGGVTRTANPTELVAGQTLTLQWEETIDHPGWYIISFDPAGESSFQNNVLIAMHPDVQNSNTLPHQYSAQITVPNTPCETCTLQMIQVMTEDPNNPRNYYSCADIRIVANGPVQQPAPTPGPNRVPACE